MHLHLKSDFHFEWFDLVIPSKFYVGYQMAVDLYKQVIAFAVDDYMVVVVNAVDDGDEAVVGMIFVEFEVEPVNFMEVQENFGQVPTIFPYSGLAQSSQKNEEEINYFD